uniref:Nucleotide-diphospho-sugar transferase domain-containing protein n=1 Tax=Arundo donax TaxID=35708 RepID=A0A0A9CV68_ARUDO
MEQRFARNLICHLDKVGMQNYIFLGDNSEFLDDLAHRGYPVIDATEFSQSIKTNSFINSDDVFKEPLVTSYVIKSCLDLGYNLWVLNGNMISLGRDLIEPSDQSFDFFIAEYAGLMFIRSTLDSKSAWNELIMLRVKAMSTSGDFSASLKQKNFVCALPELLQNSAVRLGKLNEGMKVIELGPNTSNRSISEGQSNVLFSTVWVQI